MMRPETGNGVRSEDRDATRSRHKGGAKARPYKNLPLMILIDEFWLQDTSGPQKKRRRDAGATKENAPRGSGRSFISVLVYHKIKLCQGEPLTFLKVFLILMFSVRFGPQEFAVVLSTSAITPARKTEKQIPHPRSHKKSGTGLGMTKFCSRALKAGCRQRQFSPRAPRASSPIREWLALLPRASR